MYLKFHTENINTFNDYIMIQNSGIYIIYDSFKLVFQSQNYQIVNFNILFHCCPLKVQN